MDQVRLGFVGCGTHATHNLYPAIKYARARLEAVCDLKLELAERNARLFGASASFASVDEMLDRARLDGLMIVGPPELHYEAAMKAFGRRLPVFVEKPTAPDLARVREMASAAKASGVTLMTGFMKRHGLTYGKIRQFIRSGQFVPNACCMKYTHWPMSKLRGMLLSMASHPVDLVLSFFGRPSRIQCSLGQGCKEWITLLVNLTFNDGRVAQLLLGSQVRIQERFEMSGAFGEKPSVFVVDNVMNLELHQQGHNGIDVLAPSIDRIAPEFDLSDIQVWRPDYALPNMGQSRLFVQGFAGEVREFCDAIIGQREPWPNGDDAVLTMEVLGAIAANPNGTADFA